MDMLKMTFSFLRQMAVALQFILSLLNLLLWGTLVYLGYRISQDPTLIYQLPVLLVKAASGS